MTKTTEPTETTEPVANEKKCNCIFCSSEFFLKKFDTALWASTKWAVKALYQCFSLFFALIIASLGIALWIIIISAVIKMF